METQGFLTLRYLLYGYLFVTLLISTVTDLRSRRIPNLATFSTILFALLAHSLYDGLTGFLFSLQGLGCGFFLLFVPYRLGGIGAGDVKLMAAVGAVLGVYHTFLAFLIIAIIGGVTALAMLSVRRELWVTLKQIASSLLVFCSGAGVEALQVDRTKMLGKGIPYGAVIASGTVVFVVFQIVAREGLPGISI